MGYLHGVSSGDKISSGELILRGSQLLHRYVDRAERFLKRVLAIG